MKNDLQNDIDRVIDQRDLYGRSFTYGVALYHLLRDGAYMAGLPWYDDVISEVKMAVVNQLQADPELVTDTMSDAALAETVDISVLQDIAEMFTRDEEENE